jgi:hypothetical protein
MWNRGGNVCKYRFKRVKRRLGKVLRSSVCQRMCLLHILKVGHEYISCMKNKTMQLFGCRKIKMKLDSCRKTNVEWYSCMQTIKE